MLSRSLVAAALAALVALPACDKKKPPAGPDTGPPPPADPLPRKNPKDKEGTPDPDPPADPTLLPFPSQRPVYSSGPASASYRTASRDNLKQIAIAFLNAHDALGKYPVGVADTSGKIGLSWRVALLPFVGEDNLYRQFKLDEPWNSEHNKKLIPLMPKVYAPGNIGVPGYTFYRSFTGPGTAMPLPPPGQPLKPGQPVLGVGIIQILDGTSNTLLVAEAYDPVHWTKPEELPFAPGKPPKLGGVFGGGFHAAFCDTASRFVPGNVPTKTLSDLIQINDGNPIDPF